MVYSIFIKELEQKKQMSQKNEIEGYSILSNDDIAIIYKYAYQNLKDQAVQFYTTHKDDIQTHLAKDYLIEQMTKAIVLCYKYNIKADIYLEYLMACEDNEDIKNIISAIKREAIQIRTKLFPLEKAGVVRRKLYGVEFPKIFKNNQRIYLKTSPILSETELMQDIVNYLNFSLPKSELFSYQYQQNPKTKTKRFYLFQNQPIKPVSKLFAWERECISFLSILKDNNTLLSDFFRFITKIPNDKNLSIYFNRFKKKKNFPPFHFDTVFLRHIIVHQPKDKNVCLFILENIINRLKEFRTALHEMKVKSSFNTIDEEGIDMIILSIKPNDISTMSTFSDWESCMSVDGSYYQDIMMQIGAGSIIAYGVNSKHPQKKLARTILKPYETGKTIRQRDTYFALSHENIKTFPTINFNPFITTTYQDILEKQKDFIISETSHLDEDDFILEPDNVERIYKIDKVYGLQNPLFVKILEEFTYKHLNNLTVQGSVMIAAPFYLDQLDQTYQLYDKKDKNNLISFLTYNRLAYQFTENQVIKIKVLDICGIKNIHLKALETDYLSLDADVLNEPIEHIQTSTLSICEPETFKLRTFPANLHVSDTIIFQNSTKNFDMPFAIKTKELICSNTHLSSVAPDLNVERLQISNTNVTHLPELNLKKLTLSNCKKIKNIPDHIQISQNLDISFSGIQTLPALHIYSIVAIGAINLRKLHKNIQFSHFKGQKSGLESIPNNLHAQTFIASDTFITRIPKGTCIDIVDLKNTPLVEIDPSIQIKELLITKTPIGYLPNGLSFEKLDASLCSNLKTLPSDIKVSKQLTLTGSSIQTLPFLKTETIYIINCKQISTLPEHLQVSKLFAQYSGIQFLPSNIQIDFIFLEHSNLIEIPQGFMAKTCNVSHTPLSKIGEKTKIHTLICSHTPIYEIPSSLETSILEAPYCPNLTIIPTHFHAQQKINITGSKIQELKDVRTQDLIISHCKNLKKLDSSVKFNSLDASYSNLSELPAFLAVKYLNLTNCPITQLPECLKANYIEASKTQIMDIPSTIQTDYLNLDSTKITSVPQGIHVKVLSVRNTPLTTIHYSEHLREILVDSNVKYIHPDIPNNRIKGLSNNAINKAKSLYTKTYKKIKIFTTSKINTSNVKE